MPRPLALSRRGRLAWPLAVLFVALSLSAWLPRAQAQEEATGQPEQRATSVLLVRHAEKGGGDARDPELSEAGEERAVELARLLSEAGVTHLFSTPYRRTRATLAPLAEAQGLSVTTYDPRELAALARQLAGLPGGSVAVVAGHSNTTPALYEVLGGTPRALVETEHGRLIPETSFDRLYSVTVSLGDEDRVVTHAALELRYGR